MSKRLDEILGAVEYDGLIVDNKPVADVVSISLASSQGELLRGSVVTGTPGGSLSLAKAALDAENATYILADDTDTGTGEAVSAVAYRTGHFARGKLVLGSEYALTAADEEILRTEGILLSDALDY